MLFRNLDLKNFQVLHHFEGSEDEELVQFMFLALDTKFCG